MTSARNASGAPGPSGPGAGTRAFHADHILLGDAPPLTDAVVSVREDGTIEDVGPYRGTPAERVRGVVFPGLVNAHTHLELSALRGKVSGGHGFVAWVDRLVGLRAETMPDEEEEGIRRAVQELVAHATVAVGDVSNTLAAVSSLGARGIGGIVFHEVFGLDRASVLLRIEAVEAPRCPPGLAYARAPHTLYTLHPDAASRLLAGRARTSLHLAEHAAERRAIEHGDGPVPEWLERRLRLAREWPKRPLFDVAEQLGALRPGVLLVHLTDARPDELARVAASGASVVLCPRSNLFIEGRLPPLLAVLEAGIAPALGTDSLASNTSLDVLDEARALADRFPSVPAWELVRMATANGADALGRPDLGRIARGARPGLFAIEGETNDPARFVLQRQKAPRVRLA